MNSSALKTLKMPSLAVREIIRRALDPGATRLILAHNHPSELAASERCPCPAGRRRVENWRAAWRDAGITGAQARSFEAAFEHDEAELARNL
jgi:hypothetical protein